jgi:hypothetical protein
MACRRGHKSLSYTRAGGLGSSHQPVEPHKMHILHGKRPVTFVAFVQIDPSGLARLRPRREEAR